MEKRILISRDPSKASRLIDKLSERGFHGIAIAPTQFEVIERSALESVNLDFDWIAFTSATAVEVFHDLLQACHIALPPAAKLAAMARATGATVERLFGRIDFIGNVDGGANFAKVLKNQIDTDSRLLWPSALITTGGFWTELDAGGISVTQLPIYRTIPVKPEKLSAEIDANAPWSAVLYYAPSGVYATLAAKPELTALPSVAIGNTTAKALREQGIELLRTADKPEENSVIEALNKIFPEKV